MYRKEAILRWKKKCLALGILDKQKAAQVIDERSNPSSNVITVSNTEEAHQHIPQSSRSRKWRKQSACKNRHKAVNADIDWNITCPSCKDDSKMLKSSNSIYCPKLKEADENIADTNTEVQLFTPATKKILEEIAKCSDDPTKSPAASIGLKRNLTFVDTNLVSTIKECEAAPKDCSKTIKSQPLPQNTIAESPSKKNRDKLKLS
ncbi:hypothetical protein ACH5RR_001519 [Cinchona calisaya]|uniref:Uncharacterized protein n=1 Tax=Cinchona calisaya TaxID=153742 RepID=A0ABD3B4A4_9GENT